MTKFNPYDHFGFLTHRIARLIDAMMTVHMSKAGYSFPPSCIGIMAELWQRDGQTQKQLGTSLIKNKSSINKMLEALENDGMIVKKEDPKDKRKKIIFLTEKGKCFRSIVEEIGKTSENKMLADLSRSDIQISKTILATLYEKLSDTLNKSIN